jgi:FkbM family methyltransferase
MAEVPLDTLYGSMYVPDWPNDLIVRSLQQLGEWCAAEGLLAGALLEPNETLWDAGAFLGTFSLGVAKRNLPERILAIEANPAVATILEKNLALLPCPAQTISCGLAAHSGWLVSLGEKTQNCGATSYRYEKQPSGNGSPVPCQTLSALRDKHGAYEMLKLDLEGMELEALLGDTEFLRKKHPLIWAECNESENSLKLLGGLKWLNYEVMYVAFPAFRKINFKGSSDLIYPMAYESALVAGAPNRLERLIEYSSALLPEEDVLCRSIETAYDLRKAMFDTPRWSRPEWIGLSRAELIARLGRSEHKMALQTFLNITANE